MKCYRLSEWNWREVRVDFELIAKRNLFDIRIYNDLDLKTKKAFIKVKSKRKATEIGLFVFPGVLSLNRNLADLCVSLIPIRQTNDYY